jgi:hypothetical protein
MSRKRNTFPTDSIWLLEEGNNITSRHTEIEHTLTEPLRDALETLHAPDCEYDLCAIDCDFSLLIAYYYEKLSVSELAKRYGFRNKGSSWYRLERARERLKEELVQQLGGNPYD